MLWRVCAIFDIKAEVYLPPMVFRSLGEAERVFGDICADPKSNISKHPEDYKLFELGTFNDDDAQVVTLQVPRLLMHGSVVSTDRVDSLLK